MTQADSSSIAALSDSLASAVEEAGRQIVSVSARRRSAASGVHWRAGIVVTADHVVERDEGITVAFASGGKLSATVVGRDPTTDIAVLSVTPDGGQVPVPGFGSPRVGQLVAAVARPGDAGLSVSFGALSSIGEGFRTRAGGKIDQLIHPDVTFYPRFSGGALIDVQGRVLGLNTSGIARGMPLALPVSTVDRVVDQLVKSGHISRGYLGVRMQPAALPDSLRSRLGLEHESGLLVVGVEPGGPADTAGVMVGDILISIDGKAVTESDAVQAILDPDTVGNAVKLKTLHGGEERDVTATISERPKRESRHGRRHG